MDDTTDIKKRQRIITIIGFVFLFLVLLIIFMQISSAATLHVGPGQTYTYIQDAINASNSGDTVYVHEGTYNEHVTVNQTIDLTGASWTNTTIQGGGSYDTVNIVSNWVNLSNFTITGTIDNKYGIEVTSEHVTISYCNVSSNYETILVDFTGDYLTIHNCSFLDNSDKGIYNFGSNLVLRDSTFNNTKYSLYASGSNNLIRNNSFSNDTSGVLGGPACAIDITGATNITISFNTFRNNNYAIGFSDDNGPSTDVDILNNTLTDNNHAFYIHVISYSNITGNILSSNNYSFEFSVSGGSSDNIIIWDNNISSSVISPIKTFTTAIANDVDVKWNISKTSGTNIVNGSNLGGNYWGGNYTGTDSDGDDIGNEIYNITRETGTASAIDYLPLVLPVECDVDADFVYHPPTIHPYTEVTFSDRSTGSVQRWNWDFGDGHTAAGKNQKHTYTESGSYTVTLRVYGSASTCNDKKTKTLRVTESDWHIIYPVDPKYPTRPYTVPEMYQLLNADGLPSSNAELTIVFIDSGYTPRSYNTTDLTRIEGLRDPAYDSPYDEHGHGCINGDSYIITSNGLVKIRDFYEKTNIISIETNAGMTKYIKSNTYSISIDGCYEMDHIKATHKVFVDNAIEITVLWGKKLTLTPWHPTPTVIDNGIIWKRADEVTDKDYIACPIVPSEFGEYQKIDATLYVLRGTPQECSDRYIKEIIIDEDVAWLIGYILGDGIVTKRGERVSIFDEKKELLEFAEDIAVDIGFSTGNGIRKDPRENCYELCIYSGANEFFKKIGLRNKEVPEIIFKSPISVRSAFVAGLFDAEGYVWEPNEQAKYKDKGEIRVAVGIDEKIHQGLVVILDSLGIPSAYEKILKSGYSNNPKNNAVFATVIKQKWNLQNFYDRICPFVQSFKKDVVKIKIDSNRSYSAEVKFYRDFAGLKVRKTNNIEIKDYFYDLTTEKNNNYFASGFMVHNTWVSYALAYIIQSKLPNARLISYKIFDENGECSTTQFLNALDQIKKLDPDVISFSGGGYGNPDDAFSKKIDELRASGIFVCIAAGNYGPTPSTILSPACSRGALAIGAVDPMFTITDPRDDLICIWSSRGPVPDVTPKPDFSSPGESIIGPWLKGETVKSGTSMACPLIAGGSAVIMGNNKGILDFVNLLYFWDDGVIPNLVEDAVAETVVIKTPGDSYGWGIPNFQDASNSLFWKCVFLIALWLIVMLVIIIALVFMYRYFKKDKKTTNIIK